MFYDNTGIDWDSFTPDDKYYTESAIGISKERYHYTSSNMYLQEDSQRLP